MKTKRWMAVSVVAGLLATGAAEAQNGQRLRERFAKRMETGAGKDAPARAADKVIEYGSDPLQVLDFWKPAQGDAPAPLIVFVHGGGWQRGDKDNATGRLKIDHYTGLGYGFASVNYRLVPGATVEQQAQDVAAALKALIDQAAALGIDKRRIVLMGHSAGAHLVALVGTDEGYLRGAGLSFSDLVGVVPIDGAAYDVPAQLKDGPRIMQQTYARAFGDDLARQRALSPTFQAAAPNAPAFLLPHVQRPDGAHQAEALAKALNDAGTPAQTAGFAGDGLQGHMEINRKLGDPSYPETPVVDAWLKTQFGK